MDCEIENYRLAENKLALLYLIDKMEIPLSNGQISQFALEENLMDYFVIQQCLGEMVETDFLESSQNENSTRYSITDAGVSALEYFERRLEPDLRKRINAYVLENRRRLKRDYEITANYFYDSLTNEFVVKCGVYEDAKVLMEVNVSVVTRDQAKIIVNNWKRSASDRYSDILDSLVNGKICERTEP
jgi:predicted transcriptional regulator